MLLKLILKNFRRHTDLSVDFAAGLNVIRAENEGGKSTLAEAVLYAFFGARALRDTFAETVTWGRPENSLNVELTVDFGGEVYTFTRSKGSAEVTRDGQVYVTGQNEVSNFAARLLGADVKLASHLMMANQNSLRGALEQGPKAAAELVEQLSEFDFFDELLEKMQAKLTLGSDVSAKQRLEEAEERLESLSAEKPETALHQMILDKIPAEVKRIEGEISTTLKPAHDVANQALVQAKNNRSTYDLLSNNLKKAQENLNEARTQLMSAENKVIAVDVAAIKELQAELDGAVDVVERRKVYLALEKLNKTYPDVAWEGSTETLQAEVDKTTNEIETLNQQLIDNAGQAKSLHLEIKTAEGQIQKDDNCTACGQKLQDHEEIAKRNAALVAQISDGNEKMITLSERSDSLKAQFADLKEQQADLKGVFDSAKPFDNFIRQNAAYLQVDDQRVPAKVSWKGAAPSAETADPSEIQRQISDIEAAATASRNAQARVDALAPTIVEYEKQAEEFAKQVASYALENVEQFQKEKDATYHALFSAEQTVERLKEEMREAQTQLKLAEQAIAQQEAVKAEMQARVEACKQEIKDLDFNNALLRKVRAARPIVSDKLWNMVLGAVSQFFTQIRKVPSNVTKDKDGFKVNGQSVQSLSGSALDSLGMALRVALVKTFVPNASLAIFDEPAAAADEDRSQSMIGFIQGAGFAQTILITHESDSEAVADNLITL